MHEFLIFYAPLLIVAVSIAAVFIWGAYFRAEDRP
ncbi:cytochrome bd oxidase small subunit CydS [Paenibacillus sp. 1001270B_150601_E10]